MAVGSGADKQPHRVDSQLNAIKGGGACQLREKVLAEAARTFVIVADYRKNSDLLGKTWTQGVPIEVAEFAWCKVQKQLIKMGGKPTLRMGKMKAGPVVTDNGCVSRIWSGPVCPPLIHLSSLCSLLVYSNFVIDAIFAPEVMKKPGELLMRTKLLTGVVEVGLFVGMTEAAYFGNQDGTITSKSKDGRVQESVVFDVLRNPLIA